MKVKHDLPSHLFTGKSEQNITTIKPFSLESTREGGVSRVDSSEKGVMVVMFCSDLTQSKKI